MTLLKTTLALALFIFAIGVVVFSFSNRSASTLIEFVKPTPIKLQTPTEGKDLTLYDSGGRFGCGIVRKSEFHVCQESIARARTFIWEHWDQKRRGYAIVELGSVDALSDSH